MTGIDSLVVLGLLLLGKGRRETPKSASDDGAKLMRRANQSAAQSWIATFESTDTPREMAEALARWAGLESGGNPLAVSPLGERGLLQASETTARRENALTRSEWGALIDPTTTRAAHAIIAAHLAEWLWERAAKHLTDPPSATIDRVWYAKLYHWRPVEVRDGKLGGPALPMARALAVRWKDDPRRLHALRAANVVAFGVPEP